MCTVLMDCKYTFFIALGSTRAYDASAIFCHRRVVNKISLRYTRVKLITRTEEIVCVTKTRV